MKKTVLGMLFAAALLPALAGARGHIREGSFVDSPEDVRQDVFLDVGGFAYGLPSIGYEHSSGSKNSWTLEAGYRPWTGTGYSYNQLGLSGSYRWWIAKYLPGRESRALHGIYLGPQVVLDSYSFSYDTYPGPSFNKKTVTSSSIGIGGGLEAGYQYIFRPGLMVSAGLSAGYIAGNGTFDSGAPTITYAGTYVDTSLRAGFAF